MAAQKARLKADNDSRELEAVAKAYAEAKGTRCVVYKDDFAGAGEMPPTPWPDSSPSPGTPMRPIFVRQTAAAASQQPHTHFQLQQGAGMYNIWSRRGVIPLAADPPIARAYKIKSPSGRSDFSPACLKPGSAEPEQVQQRPQGSQQQQGRSSQKAVPISQCLAAVQPSEVQPPSSAVPEQQEGASTIEPPSSQRSTLASAWGGLKGIFTATKQQPQGLATGNAKAGSSSAMVKEELEAKPEDKGSPSEKEGLPLDPQQQPPPPLPIREPAAPTPAAAPAADEPAAGQSKATQHSDIGSTSADADEGASRPTPDQPGNASSSAATEGGLSADQPPTQNTAEIWKKAHKSRKRAANPSQPSTAGVNMMQNPFCALEELEHVSETASKKSESMDVKQSALSKGQAAADESAKSTEGSSSGQTAAADAVQLTAGDGAAANDEHVDSIAHDGSAEPTPSAEASAQDVAPGDCSAEASEGDARSASEEAAETLFGLGAAIVPATPDGPQGMVVSEVATQALSDAADDKVEQWLANAQQEISQASPAPESEGYTADSASLGTEGEAPPVSQQNNENKAAAADDLAADQPAKGEAAECREGGPEASNQAQGSAVTDASCECQGGDVASLVEAVGMQSAAKAASAVGSQAVDMSATAAANSNVAASDAPDARCNGDKTEHEAFSHAAAETHDRKKAEAAVADAVLATPLGKDGISCGASCNSDLPEALQAYDGTRGIRHALAPTPSNSGGPSKQGGQAGVNTAKNRWKKQKRKQKAKEKEKEKERTQAATAQREMKGGQEKGTLLAQAASMPAAGSLPASDVLGGLNMRQPGFGEGGEYGGSAAGEDSGAGERGPAGKAAQEAEEDAELDGYFLISTRGNTQNVYARALYQLAISPDDDEDCSEEGSGSDDAREEMVHQSPGPVESAALQIEPVDADKLVGTVSAPGLTSAGLA